MKKEKPTYSSLIYIIFSDLLDVRVDSTHYFQDYRGTDKNSFIGICGVYLLQFFFDSFSLKSSFAIFLASVKDDEAFAFQE